ncbi:aminopeptidase N-like isoform X2 [Eriocheir sinensis]|uniref:aminopeptidase N-like isoform X2 n=1 Tax=Eriocheir sinensis TaxID=95602 RepID=UPI0021C7243C|nr:aminopeptidase N-like isoform X2 [Eriocheir sinensis]
MAKSLLGGGGGGGGEGGEDVGVGGEGGGGTEAPGDFSAMEASNSNHHPHNHTTTTTSSCTKNKGCFVGRGLGVLLAVAFACGLVATGLLVYYCAPHDRQTESDVLLPRVQPNVRKTPQGRRRINCTTRKLGSVKGPATTSPFPFSSSPSFIPPTTFSVPNTVTPQEEELDVRLPRSLRPLHYLVKLQPLINGNLSILGYVEVEMEVLEATTNITLHIADIITHNDTIRVTTPEDLDGPSLKIRKHEYDHDKQFYLAHLEEPLLEGQKYILSMAFEGHLNDQLHGFYRSTYRDADGTEKAMGVTQFQATDARRAFPCFDEPALKATFEVYLGRQLNMTTISNMPIIETIPMANQKGWVWDHYDTTVPMSTYLVAFVVSDFANLSTTPNNKTLFRVWARESAIQQAEFARQVGPPILLYFEEYFNQSYPLPKQDMIAIPDFSAGAMENWGLITYRETAMLYDARVSAASNKQYVAAVVAHELAHQWFGNLVTPSWWTDLWLNEGFASYVEYIGVNHVEPSWQVMEQFVLNELHIVFGLDSLESSHPISIPVGHPDEISQIFDRISYAKGASIIRMMNHFLTEVAFRRGLSTYLEAFKYDNAEQDDLWRHLTEAAHAVGTLPPELSVKAIMDTWTLQMGYPVIRVERSPDGTSASVSQERFLLVKDDSAEDTHDYKWWVPLTYTGQQRPDFSQTEPQVWMKDSEAQVTVKGLPPKDQWVIFNLQQTSYYRVNYDQHNWNLLIQQLLNDHSAIHTVNRAQIIDDVMNLAKAGQMTYGTALGVYNYLGAETELVPWAAAIDNLAYLKEMFARTGGYGALKKYLLDIVVPLYDLVGFHDHESDPLLDQYKRQKALSWACELEHMDCLANAAASYAAWMADPDNSSIISPNLKSTVYCHAIAAGDEEEWNFAWEQYLTANVGSEKNRLLSAMGCTKHTWILSRYLEMAFSSESGIRKQDAFRVFGRVASNEVGRPLAWAFLQDRWHDIYEFYGKAKSRLIKSATRSFNTHLQLKELRAFHREHLDDLDSASRAVQQVIERTKVNIAWMRTNYEVIVEWLDQSGYSTKLRNA